MRLKVNVVLFLSMLLGTIGASLMGDLLTGKGTVRAGEGVLRAVKGIKKSVNAASPSNKF